MAETDIFPLTPDYEVAEEESDGVAREGSLGGKRSQRQQAPPQRLFRLDFRRRSTDDLMLLRNFKRRLADSFFRFDYTVYLKSAGVYRTRSFPVEWFADTLPRGLAGFEQWTGQVQLLEAVGQILPTAKYPNPANGDESFFMEEDRGVAVAGTWALSGADANHHPSGGAGQSKQNTNLNTTDQFRFTYGGYGFRLWALKNSNRGIFQVKLDGVSLGNVDQYNASLLASAPLLTKTDVPLGLHTVDLFGTNTKNASSTAKTIDADALEVIY